ncbi:urease accessory protein f-like [Plakobranchus ocellatus]|uniref:Urease accessory protein f-like n=1 Tax=Plakobranchus ocellatus TaxID=259542 RepID=A0AAV4CVY5_9GAST|nr:urease accessory protein f-like [Plakobranchus ocellatus]
MEKDHQKLFAILQLTDSAFPIGGFSHSLGLEAYTQHYGVGRKQMDPQVLLHALICIIENSGSLSLPFVRSAHDSVNQCIRAQCDQLEAVSSISIETNVRHQPSGQDIGESGHEADTESLRENLAAVTHSLVQLDRMYEACSANHIARRASTRQGKSLMEASLYTFPILQRQGLGSVAVELPHHHHAVVHGAIMASLGLGLDDTITSYMFGVVRTLVTTAVRLDMIGAMEGQRLQWKLQEVSADVIQRNKERPVERASIKFPVLDILQNTQDTLFAKLFYS